MRKLCPNLTKVFAKAVHARKRVRAFSDEGSKQLVTLMHLMQCTDDNDGFIMGRDRLRVRPILRPQVRVSGNFSFIGEVTNPHT